VRGERTRCAPAGSAAVRNAALAWTTVLIATPALAQTAEPSSTVEPTVGQLQQEIRKRDALIESLARRVEKLEQQAGKRAATTPAARTPVTRAAPTSSAEGTQAVPTVTFPEQMTQAPTPLGPPVEAPPSTAVSPGASPPAPGQFEINPEAAERALERTLVATGNLLVPAGFAEIEPLLSYTRREVSSQVLFNVNRNELFPALDARLGLPWESQIEVALPWNFNEQQVTEAVTSPPQLQSNRWGNSVGDLSVGAAKTFVHESGWVPTMLGRVTWEAPTGPLRTNGVPMTSGFNRLTFSLTALKRQDPLVFVATGGYTKAFEANHLNPGNQFNFTTGAFLATSPETTLRTVLSQNFVQDISVNGVTIPGSNTVQPILAFGASSILGRGILVDLQVGLGLTNTAPKYQVILSSTYRFGVTGQ
jgi:hypothetical protein